MKVSEIKISIGNRNDVRSLRSDNSGKQLIPLALIKECIILASQYDLR